MHMCTIRRRCADPVLMCSALGFTLASTSIGIKPQAGPLSIKQQGVLPQDLVKPRSREAGNPIGLMNSMSVTQYGN